MSNSYSAQVAPLLAANADKLVFELTAPANTTVKIKKIRIFCLTYGEVITTIWS